MSRFLLAAAALSVIAACSASANVTPPASLALAAPSVSTPAPEAATAEASASVQHVSAPRAASGRMICAIQARPTANGLLFEAVGSVGAALSGEYNLVITKSGASGSSDIMQGGPFNLASGASVTLGSAELGMNRGDRYHAVLTLRDAHGVICREERRS